jgi:class 3 adenylate cyclase
VAALPETRFAETPAGRVAYQVVGDGPIDLLVARSPMFPVDMMWDEPHLVRFLERLSSFSRHIWFDPRGTGASDALTQSEDRLQENIVEDMVSVLDAAGCDRAALLGLGVPAPILFAATHPMRSRALVLCDVSVRWPRGPDYPEGISEDEVERHQREGVDALSEAKSVAPSLAEDERFLRWCVRGFRLAVSPADRARRMRSTLEADLRPTLSAVTVPTVAVIRSGRRSRAIGRHARCRYTAEHISGARIAEIPGDDLLFFAGDPDPMLDAIEEFLTGRLPPPNLDRVFATVLYTDLVGSTGLAVRLGDRRWSELLAEHHRIVAFTLERFRGIRINSTGDGVLATFDGPGRAIRGAQAIRDAVRQLGLDTRAGLHAGEVEVMGADISGIAVHIGARVVAVAGPGEILVSSTVKDLVAGSNINFIERGEHELKGIPGAWQLFAVDG